MNHSCYRSKGKERTGHRKYLLTLRRSFHSPSPSCARVTVSNFSSMTRTDVQDQCRVIRRGCCCSLTTSFLLVAISRNGFCYFFEARHPSRPTAYCHMGVHIFFLVNTTVSEVLPPNNHSFHSLGPPILVHLTGRRIVFGIEKYFDGTRSRYQSQKFGIWIQYLDISYLVRSHDTGYDITVNRDI